MEYYITYSVLALTATSLLFLFRRQPIKDWIIIYFLKGYLSGFTDSILVAYGVLSYPIRLMPNVFTISILFDLFVFPALCVIYNQTSYHSKIGGCIGQALLYSLLISLPEYWAEQYTDLIEYHKWWTIFHSYVFLATTFLLIRVVIAAIRRVSH